MISSIAVEGFKRFANETFTLRPLTVLTGKNGTGKTSLIQAFLLACEASRSSSASIALNGPFKLELGTFEDALNQDAPEGFSISVEEEGRTTRFKFSQGGTASQQFYAQVEIDGIAPSTFQLGGRCFQYLCAERMGPRIVSEWTALPEELVEIGPQGENAAQLLYSMATFQVPTARHCNQVEEAVSLLKAETEGWLSRITRPLQVDTESFPGTPMVSLKYRTGETWLKATNMGFGMTYALPIIIAALTARQGGMLVVENPEAHLHPAGQSSMGYFLGKIAAAGVQVLTETHSDHVLNGVRRAVGEHRVLKAEDALFYFFEEDMSVRQIPLSDSGTVQDWPAGFFDQYQIDVAALTRVRRGR
jgi:predicted ATPase